MQILLPKTDQNIVCCKGFFSQIAAIGQSVLLEDVLQLYIGGSWRWHWWTKMVDMSVKEVCGCIYVSCCHCGKQFVAQVLVFLYRQPGTSERSILEVMHVEKLMIGLSTKLPENQGLLFWHWWMVESVWFPWRPSCDLFAFTIYYDEDKRNLVQAVIRLYKTVCTWQMSESAINNFESSINKPVFSLEENVNHLVSSKNKMASIISCDILV